MTDATTTQHSLIGWHRLFVVALLVAIASLALMLTVAFAQLHSLQVENDHLRHENVSIKGPRQHGAGAIQLRATPAVAATRVGIIA